MAPQRFVNLRTHYLDYTDGDVVCEAYIAYDSSIDAERPSIVVAHDWSGQNQFMRALAEQVAHRGYVGFALDLYGKGVRGGEADDNTALMTPFLQDRTLLRRRLQAAFQAARDYPLIDPDRLAVLGYCFGGLCALDAARCGAAGVKGVISVHGIFAPPGLGKQEPVTAKVLILHGWEDPMAPPADLLAVARELTEAGADWQLHAYGHAMHAFTWPQANMPARGIVYNPAAHRRSSLAIEHFLAELFEEVPSLS